MAYPRHDISKHFLQENFGLISASKNRQASLGYFFVSNLMVDRHILDTAGDSTSFFPLYLYPEVLEVNLIDNGQLKREPNFNQQIVEEIVANLGLNWVSDQQLRQKGDKTTLSPLGILDYIHAVLHSPNYREKYKEFLKIDFPRIPFPKVGNPIESNYNFNSLGEVQNFFWKMAAFGYRLRQLHLMENISMEQLKTSYPVIGDNVVEGIRFENGKVWINSTQYFENVSKIAWTFYIGGYQPAQKWLKDRKDQKLSYDDIMHYQKIAFVLEETHRMMEEINW